MNTSPVSSQYARRKTSGYLAGHISMMVMAGEPILDETQPGCWQVPTVLHLPGKGEIARIGTVKIDAFSDQIVPFTSFQITSMQAQANDLAVTFS